MPDRVTPERLAELRGMIDMPHPERYRDPHPTCDWCLYPHIRAGELLDHIDHLQAELDRARSRPLPRRGW